MASIGSTQSVTASVSGGLLRAAEENTAVTATLLKKSLEADKDVVSTLLPLGNGGAGRVNIAA